MLNNNRNDKTVTLKVKRHELIKLMMLCTLAGYDENGSERKFFLELHSKLKNVLDDFDSKYEV